MKNYKNTSKKWLAGVCAAGLLAISLSSCLKQSKNNNYSPPVSLVTFIQASPDEPILDFYLDKDKVNGNPLAFTDDIDYFNAYVGKRTAIFINHSTSAAIFSDTVTLVANTPYSLFLTGKTTAPQILLLTDSITKPASGKATIRFINLSPDAPAVDLVDGSTVLSANKSYKGFSSFIPVTGNTNHTFTVNQAGTSTVLATISNVNVNSGFVYTVWLSGLVTPTGTTDKLSINSQVNAVYY